MREWALKVGFSSTQQKGLLSTTTEVQECEFNSLEERLT